MYQLEDNLASRLARLEQKLEAYRKLHADELDEIGRELGELRQELEALAKTSTLTPGRLTPAQVQPPCTTETTDRARWPSPLGRNG